MGFFSGKWDGSHIRFLSFRVIFRMIVGEMVHFPETSSIFAPENWWLEDDSFPFWDDCLFSGGMVVSGSVLTQSFGFFPQPPGFLKWIAQQYRAWVERTMDLEKSITSTANWTSQQKRKVFSSRWCFNGLLLFFKGYRWWHNTHVIFSEMPGFWFYKKKHPTQFKNVDVQEWKVALFFFGCPKKLGSAVKTQFIPHL